MEREGEQLLSISLSLSLSQRLSTSLHHHLQERTLMNGVITVFSRAGDLLMAERRRNA